jgi:hypothetical protein
LIGAVYASALTLSIVYVGLKMRSIGMAKGVESGSDGRT